METFHQRIINRLTYLLHLQLFAEKELNNTVFLKGEPLPEMFSKYFIGQAYLNMLTTTGVPIENVTFEPACRNNWHIHHKGGQILLVTEGRGWHQK